MSAPTHSAGSRSTDEPSSLTRTARGTNRTRRPQEARGNARAGIDGHCRARRGGRGAPSGQLQLRELRPQRLLPDRTNRTTSFVSSSSGSTLMTVPTPNCRMADPNARPQPFRNRLILVLVGVRRGAPPAPWRAAPVRRACGTARTTTDRARRTPDGISVEQLARNFVDESRRLGRLVFAEDPPARRRRQHQPPLCPRDPDVAEAPFLLELGFVVARARVRERGLPRGPPSRRSETPGPWRCACVIISTRAWREPASSSASDSSDS